MSLNILNNMVLRKNILKYSITETRLKKFLDIKNIEIFSEIQT